MSVQASVLYTVSVASEAVAGLRQIERGGTVAATSAAAASGAQDLQALISQLADRVVVLAALHVLLILLGLLRGYVGRSWRMGSSAELRGQGELTEKHSARCGSALSGDQAAWTGLELRMQRLFASEDGVARAMRSGSEAAPRCRAESVGGAVPAGLETERRFAQPGPCPAMGHGYSSAYGVAAEDAVAGDALDARLYRDAVPPPRQLPAARPWPHDHQPQQQLQAQAWQQQGLVQERPCGQLAIGSGWHEHFPTERHHVVVARLADAALLSYNFVEASHCFCGTAAVGTKSAAAAAGCGLAHARAGSAAALSRSWSGSESAALRQMRCLGALLVTSWGATVLIMNALIILWPRQRRPRYAWIVNSTCSWLAFLARAALLVLLAQPAGGSAPGAAAATAVQPDEPLTAVSGFQGSGRGRFENPQDGQAALAATIMLLSHLIASNLTPTSYGIQSAAAAVAGAMLHRRLVSAPGGVLAALLRVMYGSVWLVSLLLSRYLARVCRRPQPVDVAAAAAAAAGQPELWQMGRLGFIGDGAAVDDGSAVDGGRVAAAAAAAAAADSVQLAELLGTNASSPSILSRRRLRSTGLGRVFTSTFSSADPHSPGSACASTAAASDLALRTLSRSVSPRLLGPPPYPRSHSGVSSCSTWVQEGHPQPSRSWTGAVSSEEASRSPAAAAALTTSTHVAVARAGPRSLRGGRPASGEPPPQPPRALRPPPVPLALPPSQPPKRTSLDSTPRRFAPACRTTSLDPRFLQGHAAAAAGASAAVPGVQQPPTAQGGIGDGGGAAAASAAAYPAAATAAAPAGGGLQPGRLSRCGKAEDAPKAAPEESLISFVRRSSSERPASSVRESRLQQACSYGPSQAQLVSVVTRAGGSAVAPVASPPVWTSTVTGRTRYGSSGGGVGTRGYGEDHRAAPWPSTTGQGSSGLMGRVLAPGQPALAAAAAAAAANDQSVLSSIILEADAYDRLLSSASSPFLLNPGNATMRLPSAVNTGTLPLPPAVTSPSAERRGQYPPPPQQLDLLHQQQQHMPSVNNVAPGRRLSDPWSAFTGAPAPTTAWALSQGSGAAASATAAATQAAAAAAAAFRLAPPTNRQLHDLDGDYFELRSGDTATGGGGGGGGRGTGGDSEDSRSRSRGRAGLGSRSRLERLPETSAEETAPRQIIVLADGRQVYQSELLAAAASASPPSSATPLRSAAHARGQLGERPWGTSRELLTSTAQSENDAMAVGRAASPPSGAALSRHFSYTMHGGGGQSSSMEQLSASHSPYSPRSGSTSPWETNHGGGGGVRGGLGGEVARQWAPMRSQPSPPQTQSQEVQYRQPSMFSGSASGRSSYTHRGGGGGGDTSASSRFSISCGQASVAGSSAGGTLMMAGRSGAASFSTAETGGSLSGGGSGTARGGGTAGSYPRGSMDLGRHLHDTGLIRIGEEDTVPENDDGEQPASALFGTCDDGDAAGLGGAGTGSVDRYLSSAGGFSVGYGSESDRRSSAADRPSNGTTSSETPGPRDAPATVPSSYGSSSVGSGATEQAQGSAPLVTAAGTVLGMGGVGVGGGMQGQRGTPRRGRAWTGRGYSPRQHLLSVVRIQDAMTAGGPVGAMAVTASASGSSWSATGPRASVEGPQLRGGGGGGGGSSVGPVGSIGSCASGKTLGADSNRDLPVSPTLQALLASQVTASSSFVLSNLQMTATGMGSGGTAAMGSGSGGAASGGAASGAGGATAFNSGRHLSGASLRSSSSPSLLSFADVTLGFNLPPSATATGPAQTTGSYSHGQGSTTVPSGGSIVVTLARGVVSPQSSGGNAIAPVSGGGGGGGSAGEQAADAAAGRTSSHRHLADGVSGGGGAAVAGPARSSGEPSGAAANAPEVFKSGSLRFMPYPQTLGSMVGSGSFGRGSRGALKSVGTLAATATAVSGANATAGSSGRLGAEVWAGSRPTIPELLAGTAAAAVAIGNAPGHSGGAGGGASPWASPASSAPLRDTGSVAFIPPSAAAVQLPVAVAVAAAAAAPGVTTVSTVTTGISVAKAGSLKLYRLQLDMFSTGDGSGGGGGGEQGTDGSYSTGAASQPMVELAIPGAGAADSTSQQPSSQPLTTGRRRGFSLFGQFRAAKRASAMGATVSGGGGGGGSGLSYLLPTAAAGAPLPLPYPSQTSAGSAGGGLSGGGDSHRWDGRMSASSGLGAAATGGPTGRSSQQLPYVMDDTARLSPARGVLRGLRKRIRRGVQRLSGAGGAVVGQ